MWRCIGALRPDRGGASVFGFNGPDSSLVGLVAQGQPKHAVSVQQELINALP
jgi:hypothetical protein